MPPPPPEPPEENVACPPLPQAADSARQNRTRIKDAVFTLVSIALRTGGLRWIWGRTVSSRILMAEVCFETAAVVTVVTQSTGWHVASACQHQAEFFLKTILNHTSQGAKATAAVKALLLRRSLCRCRTSVDARAYILPLPHERGRSRPHSVLSLASNK